MMNGRMIPHIERKIDLTNQDISKNAAAVAQSRPLFAHQTCSFFKILVLYYITHEYILDEIFTFVQTHVRLCSPHIRRKVVL